jgi:hypothetical protein
MAKMPFTPSAEEAKAAFQSSMFYESAFTFGVPAYDPMDYSQWEMINFTRMAHARLLYEFLEKSSEARHKKDVLVADYGYRLRPTPGRTNHLPCRLRCVLPAVGTDPANRTACRAGPRRWCRRVCPRCLCRCGHPECPAPSRNLDRVVLG